MRRVAIAAIAAVVAVGCVRLGVWQLDRLDHRRQRNTAIEARLGAPTLAIPPVPAAPPESLTWRRARVAGEFDLERQVVEMAHSHRGAPAVHLMTPLLYADSAAILVERGWVPSPDGRSVDLAMLDEPARTVVNGVVLARDTRDTPAGDGWPRAVRRVDPATLGPFYPYRLLPVVLRRTERPEGAPATLGIVPPPNLDAGPHLSYAIQWFAFATIAVVGGAVLFRRQATREGGTGTRDTRAERRESRVARRRG